MKSFVFLLAVITLSGCSLVSKQYYYVPSTGHRFSKDKNGYFGVLYVYGQVKDSLGNNMGEVRTSSTFGTPLLFGPPYVPVVPIGLVTVFLKGMHRFEMDLVVKDSSGNFIKLYSDSAKVKSLTNPAPNTYRQAFIPVDTGQSYMIVNGTKKVPIQIAEVFNMQGSGYGYRITADISFAKVRTAIIVTGNPALTRELVHIVFRRKVRLSHSIIGFS